MRWPWWIWSSRSVQANMTSDGVHASIAPKQIACRVVIWHPRRCQQSLAADSAAIHVFSPRPCISHRHTLVPPSSSSLATCDNTSPCNCRYDQVLIVLHPQMPYCLPGKDHPCGSGYKNCSEPLLRKRSKHPTFISRQVAKLLSHAICIS